MGGAKNSGGGGGRRCPPHRTREEDPPVGVEPKGGRDPELNSERAKCRDPEEKGAILTRARKVRKVDVPSLP